MKRLSLGFLLSLSMSVTAWAATPDATPQVIIACNCLAKYARWACETFWWALC